MKSISSKSHEDNFYLYATYKEQQIKVQNTKNKKATLETTLKNLQYRYDHQVYSTNAKTSGLTKKN